MPIFMANDPVVINTAAHPEPEDWQALAAGADLVVVPTPLTFASLWAVPQGLPGLEGIPFQVLVSQTPPPGGKREYPRLRDQCAGTLRTTKLRSPHSDGM